MSIKQPPPPPTKPPSPTLFLTDNINMDRIPIKIKWKIHALFTSFEVFQVFKVLLIKICKIQPPDLYFLLFLLALTSADIIFHKFLELYSALLKKKDFCHKFTFLRRTLYLLYLLLIFLDASYFIFKFEFWLSLK